MIRTLSSRLRALALGGAIVLSPAIASAQGQTTGHPSTQSAPSANGSMPAGGKEKHDAIPGLAGLQMQDDKLPGAQTTMAKTADCGGRKKMATAHIGMPTGREKVVQHG